MKRIILFVTLLNHGIAIEAMDALVPSSPMMSDKNNITADSEVASPPLGTGNGYCKTISIPRPIDVDHLLYYQMQFMFGERSRTGDGCVRDNALAIRHYACAASQRLDMGLAVIAHAWCGQLHYEGGYGLKENHVEAVLCFTDLMSQPHNENVASWAKLMLGRMYYRGDNPVGQNAVRAKDFLSSVLNSHPIISMKARIYLSRLLSKGGDGVPQDHEKSMLYCKAVVNDAHIDGADAESVAAAHFDLGQRYRDGIGVRKKNPAQAVAHFKLAAEQHNNPEVATCAYFCLSDAAYWGEGIDQNYAQALKYTELAAALARQGSPEATEAYLRMGTLLEKGGHGLIKDTERASKYLRLAAHQKV